MEDGPEIHIDLPTTLPDDLTITSLPESHLPPTILNPPTTIPSTTNPPVADEAPRIETLRLDTAVPERVVVGHAFKLAVAIRQLASAVLDRPDLPETASGEIDVFWQPGQLYTQLRIQISAPDCTINGNDSDSFKLFPGRDSRTYEYHLTPKRNGPISILVTVFQDGDRLGTAGLYTSAEDAGPVPQAMTGPTRVAGEMQLVLNSQPLDTLVPAEALMPLQKIAIDLFSDDLTTSLQIAQQAGLDLAYIERSPIPAAQWWKVLAKAHAEGCIPKIGKAMKEIFEEYSDEIDSALAVYESAIVAV